MNKNEKTSEDQLQIDTLNLLISSTLDVGGLKVNKIQNNMVYFTPVEQKQIKETWWKKKKKEDILIVYVGELLREVIAAIDTVKKNDLILARLTTLLYDAFSSGNYNNIINAALATALNSGNENLIFNMGDGPATINTDSIEINEVINIEVVRQPKKEPTPLQLIIERVNSERKNAGINPYVPNIRGKNKLGTQPYNKGTG